MEAILKFFHQYGFIFEICISNFLFVESLKRRKFFVLRIVSCIGMLTLAKFLWRFLPPHRLEWDIIIYTLLFGMTVASIKFSFAVNSAMSLFCAIGAYATQHCAFRASKLTQIALNNVGYQIDNVIYIVVSLLIYLLFYMIFARKVKDSMTNYLDKQEIVTLCIAVLLFTTALEPFVPNVSLGSYVVFAVYSFLCCFFTLYIQQGMFKRSKLKQDIKIMEHIWHMQKKQYETTKDTIDLVNIKCHDLKHQLLQISGRFNSKEIEELDKAITIYDHSVKTGNEILDVILAEKSLYCQKHRIKLNCIADGAKLKFLSQAAVYSLFGNAIDNAIEAVSKIENIDKRIISLTIKEALGMVSVHIENYYDGNIKFDNELPLSTKEDIRYHGFGMKSIKLLTEKYDGIFSIKTEGEIFNLNLLFPC